MNAPGLGGVGSFAGRCREVRPRTSSSAVARGNDGCKQDCPGDPCRTPLLCGMLVMRSPMATRISRASSSPSHTLASHGCPPMAVPPDASNLPTRASTSCPIDSCHTESNAFRMSSFTTHTGTRQSRAIRMTRRSTTNNSVPCLPFLAHWYVSPLGADGPPGSEAVG